MLPLERFKTVIASAPLISIDLIVRNNNQEVLLGRRINRPAQGFWFVPGGRVLKDESLECAFKRLLRAELGLEGLYFAKYKGTYQHFYDDNMSSEEFSSHYVVLAYEVEVKETLQSLPEEQHDGYRWLTERKLLLDNNVHQHTKWYFQKGQNADAPFLYSKNERN